MINKIPQMGGVRKGRANTKENNNNIETAIKIKLFPLPSIALIVDNFIINLLEVFI